MIFIENNKINPIAITISANINTCSEYVFEFIDVLTERITYFVTDNVTNSISYFDLFELTEDSTIPQKKYNFNEPINLTPGQYTTYIYKCEVLPIDETELMEIINEENKVYVTKMVVDISTDLVSNIPTKYL